MKKILTILITLILSICLINVNTNKTNAENADLEIVDRDEYIYMRTSKTTTVKFVADGVQDLQIEAQKIAGDIDSITLSTSQGSGAGPATLTITPNSSGWATIAVGIKDQGPSLDLFLVVEDGGKIYNLENYVKGSGEDFTFLTNDEYNTFMGGTQPKTNCKVQIKTSPTSASPTVLTYSTDYTASEGCLLIKINSSVMANLPVGDYWVDVISENGTVTGKFSVDNPTPTPNPDISKGELVYDSSAHGGDGAFVGNRKEKHASLPAIANVLNIEADSVDVYYYSKGSWSDPLGSGYEVKTSKPTTSNRDKYTKVILTQELLNVLPLGKSQFKIDITFGSQNVTYYVDLDIDEYVDPTPVDPTYESCEKVIGPTWHWNESKGICEEYATVGTSTK